MNRWQFQLFSPAKWPHRELVSRCTALFIIACFLVMRVIQFDQFPQTLSATIRFYSSLQTADGFTYSHQIIGGIWVGRLLVWLIETGIFIGYIASYLSRTKAVSIADGFMETAFPVIVAGLPIVIALTPYTLPQWAPYSSPSHVYLYITIMGLIMLGGLINLIGLVTMRHAFTIMTEARTLITSGIFRVVRHPLYTGHIIMFFGSLLLRFHYYTLALYFLFVIGQMMRARLEERKLENAFPEYAAYKRRTGMFFPNLINKNT